MRHAPDLRDSTGGLGSVPGMVIDSSHPFEGDTVHVTSTALATRHLIREAVALSLLSGLTLASVLWLLSLLPLTGRAKQVARTTASLVMALTGLLLAWVDFDLGLVSV